MFICFWEANIHKLLINDWICWDDCFVLRHKFLIP